MTQPDPRPEPQPRTDAGRAMMQAWAQRSWSRMALRLAILAIEDEALASPARPEPGLDVERMARALVRSFDTMGEAGRDIWRKRAAILVAEYERPTLAEAPKE